MVGGKRNQHTVRANVKEFSKNALSATNRAIATTISTYTPFISASLMNASTAAFDVTRFAKENNPLTRNKNRDPYVRRAINRATDAFQTSLNELRQGHLSFEETRNEISEYINENSESEWDSMAASADGEAGGAGGGSQKQFSVSDYVKGVAASSRSNVRALQVTTNKITESQYKSLNLATSKIISSNMANMQAITRQFSVTNSRIENVNANLVNLVQFNNTTMSEFIGTATEHMGKMESYLEEMLAYARLENEKRINHYNGTGAKHRSQREQEESKDFLSYGFDPGKYAKSIIDNLMETAFGPTVLTGIASGIKGIFGKVPNILADYAAGSLGEFIQQFNPLGFVIEKFMPSLKGFSSVDDIIQGTIKSFFSQLGSGTYDGPFSEIARIFGIKGSTANVSRGDYNHGEAPWTGEDSRALKQVIPDYLSTIELKISNMVDQSIINTNAIIDSIRGIQTTILQTSNKHVPENKVARITGVGQSATNSRRLYDYEAGDFTTENKIIDKLRSSLQRSASMYYDDSKDIMKAILQYADAGKMSNSSNKKALSDALTAIFMNFNAVDGETALTRDEMSALVSALQGLGIDTQSKDIKDLFGQFINKTQERRLTVNRDVGQQFQQMRNLGLGAGTNDISTDIVNHNREVIASAQNVFTLDSILRTLDDDLSNFEDFKRTDAYKNMDNETKRAYAQAVRDRDNVYMRQGVIAAILDPSKLAQNPFNVVAGTVVNSTTAVAVSLNNVVTGVSSFSEEIQNITQTIREAVLNIKSAMTGGRPDLGGLNGRGHDSGATNVPRDSVVKVHKGEIILDPALSDRVRDGIVDFINGDMSEKKFNKKVGKGLTESQVEEIKFIKQAMQSAGKLKIKRLDDVTDQIWDAAKFIDKAPTPEARLELLLRQIARNQEVGLLADNIGAIGESDRDSESLDADRRDRRLQTLRHGIGKINKDGLYEGGMLSDFANSVKGTYDKVINSLVGKAYNTYEDDGQGGKKLVHHEKNDESFLNRYKNWLVKRAESVADAFGMKGEHKENISKTFEFIGENGHKLVIGGLAGMAANIVLPISCGPLIGISAALISSSKNLNERLFGTENTQTGRRNNDGLISSKVTNFVKEHMFSLISGGVLGMKIMKTGPVSKLLGAGATKITTGLTGLLGQLPVGGAIGEFLSGAVGIAFGPVGGALLGMGVAAMSQSEHVKKFLFGDDDGTGKRTGGIIGDIKKSFTKLGNSVKEHIFGKDVQYLDKDGNVVHRKDGSGLLNRLESAIYAHLLRPMTTSAKYIGKYFIDWFKDDVLNASKRVISPVLDGVERLADTINGGIRDSLYEFAQSVKSAFTPVTKAITGLGAKVARATLTGVENVVKLSLKSVSAPLNIAAALLGKTNFGKPGFGAKMFMGDARGKINRMMFGENVRLFFDELGNARNQKLRLDNTVRMTGDKKAKDGLKEKLERYLDRNEKLFSKFKTISDFFKAIGNTPFGASIKAVFNTLTHPISVVLSSILDGAIKGLKDVVTAPFKLITLPFKGIKKLGEKITGAAKSSYLGTAISNFKERMGVLTSGGSDGGSKNELTKNFAKTYNKLNEAVTERTHQDGLITRGVRGTVDALREHNMLKNEKKNLEKQHRRDKAVDKYISKLNLKMSPAEFDRLSADKRNKIISDLVRKSGDRSIAEWDEEKLRALVTGGRSKVQKLEAAKGKQENATDTIVNLPDTLKENTEKITDKLQDIFDALIGKKTRATEEAKPETPALEAPTLNVPQIGASETVDVSASVDDAMKMISIPNNAPKKKNKRGKMVTDYEAIAENHLSEIAKSLGINIEDIDENDKKALIKNISKSLTGKTGDKKRALGNVRGKLISLAQKAAQEKTAQEAQEAVTEPAKTGVTSRIKSWFEFNEKDLKQVTAKNKRGGEYVYDAKSGELVKADTKDKEYQNIFGKKKTRKVFTGNTNLTKMGAFKKWVRDRRDGNDTSQEVPLNEDGTLNTDKLTGLQSLIANATLGFGWRKKKSKGLIKREQEEALTEKLKMLATGDGKAKIITTIIKKVLSGLVRGGVFLAGMGLFATKLLPIIKDPVKKLLFGDPNVEGDGLFGFLNGLWTDKIKPGIKNVLDTGFKWAFGDPANPDDRGAIGKVGDWLSEKLPDLIYKGAQMVGDLAKILYDSIVKATTHVFVELDPFGLIKQAETTGDVASDTAAYSAFHSIDENGNETFGQYKDKKTGEIKTFNDETLYNYVKETTGGGLRKYVEDGGNSTDYLATYGTEKFGNDNPKYHFDRSKYQAWFEKTDVTKTDSDNMQAHLVEYRKIMFDPDKGTWHKDNKVSFIEDTDLKRIVHFDKRFVDGDTDLYTAEFGYPVVESEYKTGVIGYGHFTQNDPRWARLGYGKMRNGGMSTMANGGCGPTAMANAINNVYGRNVTNPLTIANYASKNGYSVDGGTSAGLFNRGAKGLGVNSSVISKSGSSIANQLRHGKNVIVAGRGGSAYTSAGHIMSVRGIDRGGNAIVDDPMRRKSRHIPMNKLTRGMTHAWSIGRGPDSDAYYGTSPDGSNYAFLSPYFDVAKADDGFTYFDTNTGEKAVGEKINSTTVPLIPASSIMWGYDGGYRAACLVKSIAAAVFNYYTKKKGYSAAQVTELMSKLGDSYAQPHSAQSSGKCGVASDGTVNHSATLANSVFSALNGIDPVSTSGISLDEHRSADGTSQKSAILTNLMLQRPVVIHTNPGTSKNLPDSYRRAVFGRLSSGATMDNHAVILNGLVNTGKNKYVLVGDPGSANASDDNYSTGRQVRFVDFNQLTDQLGPGKLNHLWTINDGTNVPLIDVPAPDPTKAMGTSSSGGMKEKLSTAANTVTSKFTSFTEWIAGLAKHAIKVGSALMTAIFSGRSFKEVWAEMNTTDASSSATAEQYAYDGSKASEEQRAVNAQSVLEKYSDLVDLNKNARAGLKYINQSATVYNLSHYMNYKRTSGKGENLKTYYYLINDFTSVLAKDILGLAVFYLKTVSPYMIEYDTNFNRWCVLAANMLARVKKMEQILSDYKSKKLFFRDETGICMFMAHCIEKLLLPDSDAKACGNKFLNLAMKLYDLITGRTYIPDSNSKKQLIESYCKNLQNIAATAIDLVYEHMQDKAFMFTYEELLQISSSGTFKGKALDQSVIDQFLSQIGGSTSYAMLPAYAKNPDFAANNTTGSKSTVVGSGIASMNVGPLIDYLSVINTANETGGDINNPNDYEKIYYSPEWLSGESNVTLGRGGFYDSNAAEIFKRMAKAESPLSESEKQIASDYYNRIKSRTFGYNELGALKSFLLSSKEVMQAAKDVQDAMAYEFVSDTYIGKAYNAAMNAGVQDPRSVLLGAEFAGVAPAAVPKFYSQISGNVGRELSDVRDGMFATISGFSNYGRYGKGWKNRINGDYNMLTSLSGYNTQTGRHYPISKDIISMIPEGAEASSEFIGAGPGNRAVNIHDAMMNTPTSDIYTRDDDIYMGDANHPMNVKMDTSPTTSRLDVIISLLGELLKGDNSLPPATSKATESVAGYGEGKSKSSNNTIVVANQNKKPDKANTNMKRDRLRSVYDQISKRALTYTH